MARDTDEWIEYDHNKKPPGRVKDRVVLRADRCCQNCGVRVASGGEVDHIPAVVLLHKDEPQRESCLQFLCGPCHKVKTGQDVAKKAESYKKRKRHGPLSRDEPKMKTSRKMDGTVCRWNPETRKYDIVVWPKGKGDEMET